MNKALFIKTALLIFSLFFCYANSYAAEREIQDQKLTLQEVVNSAVTNYPKVLALYEEIKMAEGSVLASKGFFDIRLRQQYVNKTRGYYDGEYTDTQLAKNNAFLGSKMSLGYRKSFHNFENHETQNITSQDGEFRAEASFSLLQNSMIDKSRLKLILARLSLEESKLALLNIKNKIRQDAKKSYYNWIISGQIYEIYKELYKLAIKRNKQLEVRVEKGDIASIILLENERNALSRKTSMIKARQKFENAAIYLSLFYRDKNGEPIMVKNSRLPEIDLYQNLTIFNDQKINTDLATLKSRSAPLKIIDISQQKESQNLKQARNLYKPKLDVKFKASNDIANQNEKLGQTKNEVRLDFEMPLQRRMAKGEINKSKAKIDKIKYEEKLMLQSAKVNLLQIQNSVNAIVQMHENLKKEVEFSVKLENAEKTRFNRGGSDFFLINMREQNTASAQITNAIMVGDYFKKIAEYEATAFLDL